MKLHDLRPALGSKKKKKRIGRGPGSGSGKTSGKGHKGMLARSGRANVQGFEGGQMPLARRLPKRGFHNVFQVKYAVVNVKDLALLEDISEITPKILIEKGLVKRRTWPVKILGKGELTRSLVVEAHKFSQSALQKIEQAGGQVRVTGRA
ncbi:MAG: 50S ribosomal protein L15 [Nitrospirales bacterium]|nr:50S ribosomal protein L15 [Nitrospirales bacterium]